MVENNVTRIDDVEIPWGLLFLDFLGATLPMLYKAPRPAPG